MLSGLSRVERRSEEGDASISFGTRIGGDWTRRSAKRRDMVGSKRPGHMAFLGIARIGEYSMNHTEKPEVDGSTPSLTTSPVPGETPRKGR
jgi:hypothetical protein